MKNLIPFLLVFVLINCACTREKSEIVEEEPEFNEPYRAQFHFTPPSGWMNDPNGMVYHGGEYHLFYQYNPDSTIWGPMHWGHAVSKDLIHWEHLPIALYPDSLGTIFSGSAVVDRNNTSGLGTDQNPPMVAIFTSHNSEGERAKRDDYQTQSIAYSTDNGRTWAKYEDNPVIKNPGIRDFRDPKVVWVDGQNGEGKWTMALAVKDRISFYSSPNLIDWTHESDFNPEWAAYGGVWECPDLFPLTTNEGDEKWVLLVSINPGGPNGGSATQYFVGDFDGSGFKVDNSEVKWLDYGADNYAGVTWSDIPEEDGRRLFIGWMSNWLYAEIVPTENWRSAMTLPRTLELVNTGEDYLVASRPVEELEKIRFASETVSGEDIDLTEELVEMELNPSGEDFSLEFSNPAGEKLILTRAGASIILDRSQSGLIEFSEPFGKPHTLPVLIDSVSHVRIFLDRSSVEVFFNEGELVMTDIIFPTEPYNKVALTGFQNENTIHYLNSIW
jgi:fructan beta-fructosidase